MFLELHKVIYDLIKHFLENTIYILNIGMSYLTSILVLTFEQVITKTGLYNFDPLKPHFCIVKLGFTGVYIIFLISAQKHRLWVWLELPH